MRVVLMANERRLFNRQVTRRIWEMEDNSTPMLLVVRSYRGRSIQVHVTQIYARTETEQTKNTKAQTESEWTYQDPEKNRKRVVNRVQEIVKGRPITCRSSHV